MGRDVKSKNADIEKSSYRYKITKKTKEEKVMLKLSGKDYARLAISVIFMLVGMAVIPALAISGYLPFDKYAAILLYTPFVLGVFSIILLCDIYARRKYLGKEIPFERLKPGEYYIESAHIPKSVFDDVVLCVSQLIDPTAGGGGLYEGKRFVIMPRGIKRLKRFFVIRQDGEVVDSANEPPTFFGVPSGELYIKRMDN